MNKNNKKETFATKHETTLIKTITFKGWEIIPTEIEISITPGIPIMSIVGLPNKTVNESKERIRCVLSHLGIGLPIGRIIINLSPADLIKDGTHYDLGILCGLLIHLKLLNIEEVNTYIFFGELQLNGDILPTQGGLPVGIFAYKNNLKLITSSLSNKELTALENKFNIFLFTNVLNLLLYFQNYDVNRIVCVNNYIPVSIPIHDENVYLAPIVKRLMEITLIGNHNILLYGPPGGGKTTLAKILSQLLPDLTKEESLEVSSIYSMCGLLNNELLVRPPFRAPHASCSVYSLLGGGSKPKPGEVSLAHKGLLFLDELNNFESGILDSLRECLTEDIVRVSRVNYHITYPSEIQLIAAMNPCKCGFLGSQYKICTCSIKTLDAYKSKISGPFLNRIAIKFFLEEANYNKAISQKEWIQSTRQRILRTREKSKEIFKKQSNTYKISRIPFHILEENLTFTANGEKLLKKYCEDKKLSIRSYNNLVRLAFSISLYGEANVIHEDDISEGIFFASNYN
jgi:magnesium chelatase family protein